MILANGKQYDASKQSEILEHLEEKLEATLASPRLDPKIVIDAIDALGKKVAQGYFDERIASLQIDGIDEYMDLATKMLTREYLEFKLRTELGEDFSPEKETNPPQGLSPIRVLTRPLGVLLHIAAGNVDGLPAFSAAEGLLTGNINILKLPQADKGLSVEIISELISIEPRLADYIYVFDTPSSDVAAIQKMASMADALVVWGGEAAVSAVRRFASPGTRLIEWGHRLSFSYLAGEIEDRDLHLLAEHIITTQQLLCSSCQVIYLDTNDQKDILSFCERFYPILEKTASEHRPATIGSMAELTLKKRTDKLERILNGGEEKPWTSPICSVIPKEDEELELSPMFGNILVKKLPREHIIPVLRRKKQFLQTVGLACPEELRNGYIETFIQAGITRVTYPGDMSSALPGEAHDGTYPLRRYVRIVDVETK